MNLELPLINPPHGWIERRSDSRNLRTDRTLVEVIHEATRFTIRLIDSSPAADTITIDVEANPSPTSNAGYTLITTVSDGAEATGIATELVSRADYFFQDGPVTRGETPKTLITAFQREFEPVNTDTSTGHPVESTLEEFPIAVGGDPSTVCPVTGEVIYDSPVNTPRVTCYATGDRGSGWTPHEVFHSRAGIETVDAARAVFPTGGRLTNQSEVVVSALVMARPRMPAADNESRHLELRDVAVLDEE